MGLFKAHTKKTTPPAVKIEPAIHKLQMQAFTNYAILAHK